jgi:hypothetical protein
MDIKDLLPIIFERSNAMQTFWNFQITVIFGPLGFITTARATARQESVNVLLTVGYVMFALVNLEALMSVTKQRWILVDVDLAKLPSEELLTAFKEPFLFVQNPLSRPYLVAVIIVHFLADAFLVGAIRVFPRLSKS